MCWEQSSSEALSGDRRRMDGPSAFSLERPLVTASTRFVSQCSREGRLALLACWRHDHVDALQRRYFRVKGRELSGVIRKKQLESSCDLPSWFSKCTNCYMGHNGVENWNIHCRLCHYIYKTVPIESQNTITVIFIHSFFLDEWGNL